MSDSKSMHFIAEVNRRKLFNETLNPLENLRKLEKEDKNDCSDAVFYPLPCAEEIVSVLEKHGVSIRNMEKVFAIAKDIAFTNTKIQSS